MQKKIEITSELLNNLIFSIEKKDNSSVLKIITEMHAADIAEILENLPTKEAQLLFELVDQKRSADVIVELDDDLRESLLSDLTSKEIAEEVIDNLESDDAADIIGEFPGKQQEEILALIEDAEHANDISDLLTYEENSAGGLMAKELIQVNENWDTKKCLKEMHKQAKNVKKVYSIYVVDNNKKLLGTLSLRQLLLSQSEIPIKKIIKKDIASVNTGESSEAVANIMNKYDLIAIPVVDRYNRLIGRITLDDVIDIVKEEAEKDYQMASGISEDIEANDKIWTLTRARLPWLLIGMIGGVLGAKIIGVFDIKNNFELAFFIPLIAAMAGNVGVQSAAIIVQGLANNKLKLDGIINKLMKEFGVAFVNGIICAIIILGISFTLGYNLMLCITVSISLLSVIIFAALFGTCVPLILHKNKIDPALATGPFITTVNDILGLIIYFIIGEALLI